MAGCALVAGCSSDEGTDPGHGATPPGASAHYTVDDPNDPNVVGVCNQTVSGAIAPDEQSTAELPLAQSDLLPSNWGQLVRDSDTHTVSCRVSETTGGYNVSMQLRGTNVSFDRKGATGATQLDIANGFIDGSTGVGQATVRVHTSLTSFVVPNTDCTLMAAVNPDGSGLSVQPGQAKFVFTCPDTTSQLDDFSTCETRGAIWVSDCDR